MKKINFVLGFFALSLCMSVFAQDNPNFTNVLNKTHHRGHHGWRRIHNDKGDNCPGMPSKTRLQVNTELDGNADIRGAHYNQAKFDEGTDFTYGTSIPRDGSLWTSFAEKRLGCIATSYSIVFQIWFNGVAVCKVTVGRTLGKSVVPQIDSLNKNVQTPDGGFAICSTPPQGGTSPGYSAAYTVTLGSTATL